MSNQFKCILKAHDLVKSYGNRLILHGAHVQISTGEVVGLLGPNGAGKTTCFSIIVGLISPNEGRITLNDVDITNVPMFKRAQLGLSYLPQEASIFRGLSVEDNIKAILELKEKDQDALEAKLDQLLADFDISHLRTSSSQALSGGERRRLEIARALALDPMFLMLDEPFAGIDPIAVNEIRELILRLKKKNIGVLITDHNVRETLDIVDRAYILAGGRILMEGTSEEILQNPDVRRVYLGDRFSI
ncbi:MAG TPA: LPS export ABC transporter ATP-binding protein [Alphaproteobacteria bacterium]|nr:LPS export ABC transporter ATP-binding protein [Alphaproteobacteria bacterium]